MEKSHLLVFGLLLLHYHDRIRFLQFLHLPKLQFQSVFSALLKENKVLGLLFGGVFQEHFLGDLWAEEGKQEGEASGVELHQNWRLRLKCMLRQRPFAHVLQNAQINILFVLVLN